MVRPFITGYVASSLTVISIKISHMNLKQRSFDLNVEVGEKMVLDEIIVSYLVFDFQG